MEQRNSKSAKRSKTKITPPKKKRPQSLSRDEVRSINKKKIIRKRKAKRVASLAALAVAVFSVGVVLVLTVFFKIGTIKVTGDKVYANKDVILHSGIEVGDNLFRVSERKLNDKLTKTLPYIAEITVERDLPDTLVLNVTATREVAAFQWQTGYILVDSNGKVLDRDASLLRDNVAVVNGYKLRSAVEGETIDVGGEETTQEFIGLLTAIKESGLTLITEISVTEKGEFELVYDDRVTMELGSSENLTVKVKRAEEALSKELEGNPYFEGKMNLKTEPYIYFSSGEEETTVPNIELNGEKTETDGDETTTQNNNSDNE